MNVDDSVMPAAVQPEPSPAFYIEATLPLDARSYIKRNVDDELFESLRGGQFSYVLDASQVGKSSLMLRVKQCLDASGARTALIDLQRIGLNVTPEQFYSGLVSTLAAQLADGRALWDTWRAMRSEGVGAAHRWLSLLRHAAARSETPLVLFIDEVQIVRGQPVCDEFFAAIRSAYTERVSDAVFRQLTFCLLGTATAADLTRDPRVPLLNIGHQIRLADFTEREAAPLAEGLSRPGASAGKLLRRVLYWTDGHPYLTQRVCLALAERPEIRSPRAVDRLCREVFFGQSGYNSLLGVCIKWARACRDWVLGTGPSARISDANLLWVKRNLLTDDLGADASGDDQRTQTVERLTLYRKVLQSRVSHDVRSPALDTLRIAGVVKLRGRHFRVRNRIYERVFSRAWVKQEIARRLDDAAVREERRWRLTSRLAVAAGLIVFAGLVGTGAAWLRESRAQLAVLQTQAADAEGRAAAARATSDQERRAAEAAKREADKTRLQISEAGRQLLERERELQDINKRLTAQIAARDDSERLATLARMSRDMSPERELAAAGQLLLGLSPGSLWNTAAEYHFAKALRQFAGVTLRNEHRGTLVTALTTSTDGRWVATGDDQGAVRLWDTETGRASSLAGHQQGADVRVAAFSKDGHWLLTGGEDEFCLVWDLRKRPLADPRRIETGEIAMGTLSDDGQWLATMPDDTRGDVSIRPTQSPATEFKASYEGTPQFLTFLPGPTPRFVARIVTSRQDAQDSKVFIWTLRPGASSLSDPIVVSRSGQVAVHPNGRILALIGAGTDGREIDWLDASTGRPLHSGRTESVAYSGAFSADGRQFFTGHADGALRVWSANPGTGLSSRLVRGDVVADAHLHFVRVSPDGRVVLAGGDNRAVRLWDTKSGHVIELAMTAGRRGTGALAGGGDQSLVAVTATSDGEIQMWNLAEVTAADRGAALTLRRAPDNSRQASEPRSSGARGSAPTGRSQTESPENVLVRAAAYDPTGSWIAAFPYPGGGTSPRVWPASNPRDEGSWAIPHEGSHEGVFDPAGKLLTTLKGRPFEARVWDVRSRREIRFPHRNLAGVVSAAFVPTPSGSRPLLAVAGVELEDKTFDGRLSLWRIGPTPLLAAPPMHFEHPVGAVATWGLAGDTAPLAVIDSRGRLFLVRPRLLGAASAGDARLAQKVGDEQLCAATRATAFDLNAGFRRSSDGQTLAAADTTGTIHLWRTAGLTRGDCAPVGRFSNVGRSRVEAFELGPRGLVAASYSDGAVRLQQWDGSVTRDLGLSQSTAHRITSWAFSPDGRYFAANGSTHGATLWDVSTRLELDVFAHGEEIEVNGVAFHPNGTTLVTAADRGQVHMWPILPQDPRLRDRAHIRELLARYTRHQPDVTLVGGGRAAPSVDSEARRK